MESTERRRTTPSHTAKVRYLDAGLHILAEQGHGGLKLATVCKAVGATTGSFYHAFPSWGAYTAALIRYWRAEKSQRLIADAAAIDDPLERLTFLTGIAPRLPHDTEAAIRVWADKDTDVRAIQAEVDEERRIYIADAITVVTGDRAGAERHATAAMYLLVGYENGTHRSVEALDWALQTLLTQVLAGVEGVATDEGTARRGDASSTQPSRPYSPN